MAITNTKFKGRNLVLKIGDSAVPGSAVFTTIGGVRAKGASSSVEEIDITDGDDSQWKKLLEGGVLSMTLSVSGLVSNNVSYELLRAKHQTGVLWAYQLDGIGDGDNIKVLAQVTSFEETGEYNGAQTFTATLAVGDDPIFTNA